jgi:hypothetical protein
MRQKRVDAVSLRGSRQAVIARHSALKTRVNALMTGQSIGLSQNSYALMEKDLRRRRLVARAIIPRRCAIEKTAAPELRSTRSFGEYAFLEDSRYASQMENI